MTTRCTPDYLPFLLAYDFNFLPDDEAKYELDDLGDDNWMILLASFTIPSNILFKYDHEWTES